MIILDFGSGNTCRNNLETVKTMIDKLKDVDTKRHRIIIKWQLFTTAPPNVPLDHEAFDYAYHYAQVLGYETTASVFDRESLRFLQKYPVPFIKIANNSGLYYLANETNTPVYASIKDKKQTPFVAVRLACVSNYPASIEDYEAIFDADDLKYVSDHTVGWDLYKKYQPEIIEKHYVHARVAGNPDAGRFAVTPNGLKEIL